MSLVSLFVIAEIQNKIQIKSIIIAIPDCSIHTPLKSVFGSQNVLFTHWNNGISITGININSIVDIIALRYFISRLLVLGW